MALLVAFRLGPEEQMMREEFGGDYEAYLRRTKRLVPGIW
jgi:protein-S-isoprenylcysteine O-methyltransferase Ste14